MAARNKIDWIGLNGLDGLANTVRRIKTHKYTEKMFVKKKSCADYTKKCVEKKTNFPFLKKLPR